MTSGKKTVVIVDDHELFRHGVAAMLNISGSFSVSGHGTSSEDAVDLCRTHRPNFLILDVELHDQPVTSTIRRVLRETPTTKVIVLSMHRERAIIQAVIRAGASAYLNKSIPRIDFMKALDSVDAGSAGGALGKREVLAPSLLSARELEVLSMLATPLSMKEIGRELSIAEGTVKRHVSSIYRKLEVRSRIQALPRAEVLGLLIAENSE